MQDETENRIEKVKESYWAMSNLYMTVATPTLSNAGKPHGQLSSCFIDTVDDSLQGIYDSNTDIANFRNTVVESVFTWGKFVAVVLPFVDLKGLQVESCLGLSN